MGVGVCVCVSVYVCMYVCVCVVCFEKKRNGLGSMRYELHAGLRVCITT